MISLKSVDKRFPDPWQALFLLGMLSVFLLPQEERFFPLSRYPMFSNPRPLLEPLPFVEVESGTGERRRVPLKVWNKGGMSNGRNQLQSVLGKSNEERKAFCQHVAAEVFDWLEQGPDDEGTLWIMGGRFRRADVLLNTAIEPVNSQPILGCRLEKRKGIQ